VDLAVDDEGGRPMPPADEPAKIGSSERRTTSIAMTT